MRKVLMRVNRWVAELGGLLMTIMMILFLVNIVSREINKPIQGLLQMAVFAMISLIYLGLAYCEEKDEHVRLEVLMSRLPLRMREKLRFLCVVIEWLTVTLVLYAVGLNAWSAFETKACVTGTKPMFLWPVKFLMVIGLFIFWVQLIFKGIDYFKRLLKSGSVFKDADYSFDEAEKESV